MQNIGYNERNAFKGMGTMTFVIFLYFTRVIFALILGLTLKYSIGKSYEKRLQ